MVENERSVKQNYLRVEIVEKGFDSELFLSFLSELKGDEAAEIDNWSFEELKIAVANFKAKIGKDGGNNVNNTASRKESQGSDPNPSTSMTSMTSATTIPEVEDSGPMPKDVI